MTSWPYEDQSTQYMVEGMRFRTNFLVSIKYYKTCTLQICLFFVREKTPEKLLKILGSLTIPFRKMNPFLGVSKWGTFKNLKDTAKQSHFNNNEGERDYQTVEGFSLQDTLRLRANGRNVVGQQLPTLLHVTCCVRLHTLLHVVGCYCVLLRKVWNRSNF